MRRLKKITLIVFLCLISFTAIADEHKIHVICDVWPPYQFSEHGRLGGFSTKVVKEVLTRMGVEIHSLESYPWKRALSMIEKNKVDALFSANYTQERKKFAYYPDEEIVQSPWVVWSREEDGFEYNSLNDLMGKSIGVVRGYSYTPQFLEFIKSHNNFDEAVDDTTNFKKLNFNRVDVVIAELGNGYSVLKTENIQRVVPHKSNPIKVDGLYMIFNKYRISQAFVDRFSNELKKFKQESVYKIWYDEYFSMESTLKHTDIK